MEHVSFYGWLPALPEERMYVIVDIASACAWLILSLYANNKKKKLYLVRVLHQRRQITFVQVSMDYADLLL